MGPIVLRTWAIVMAHADDQCCALSSSGHRPSLRHPAGWDPPHKGAPFPAWALASTRAHTLYCMRAWAAGRSVVVSVCVSAGRPSGPFCAQPSPPPGASPRRGVKARKAVRGSVWRGAPAPGFAGPGPAHSARCRGRAALAVPPASPGVCPRPCAPSVPPWALGGPARRFSGRGPVPARPLSWVWWWSGCGGRGGPSAGPLKRLRARGLPACPPGAAFGPRCSPRGAGRFL